MPSLELSPVLYAVGGSVPGSLAATWIPSAQGWLPSQCYALKSGDELLLIDAGLAVHRAEIARSLRPLVSQARRHSIATTRREPDTIINVPWLMTNLGFTRLFLSGLLNPLDYFESFEFRSTQAHVEATCDIDITWLEPGQPVEVGGICLQPFQPLVRVLATEWYFHQPSGTLFTSDFGGFFCADEESGPFVWSGASCDLSAERIAAIIGTKCEWLRSIDTRPMIENVRQAWGGRDVKRICPSFGGIVEGRENVLRLLECVVEALGLLSRQPRVSPLKDFDWSTALSEQVTTEPTYSQ